MRYLRWIIGALFALAAGLAASSPLLAAAPPLPYQMAGLEWVLQEAPHPDCGPGRLKVEVAGMGQAAHLGQYTIVRQHCFNLATFSIEEGSFEQTAANGDKLWGTYTGYTAGVLEFAPDGSPLVILIQSPTQITGGTGRFAGAQGEGLTTGVFNVVTKIGDFSFTGHLSYQAANRADR